MADKKLSKAELEAMLASYDEDPEVDEIIVEDETGKKFHLKGGRATTVLDKLFADYGFAGAGGEPGDGDGGAGGDDSPGDEPPEDPPAGSVWGRKR